jgi:thioredoxin-like negative regulator of GroEL
MKKYWPLFLIIPLLILLVIGILSRNTLNNFISEKMKEQATTIDSVSVEKYIELNYNYVKNESGFEFTLLEFGSGACAVCKQMEPVLEEIRQLENPKVKVVFLNIMQPENLSQMKYFGISAVPMQIVLNLEGKEIYRHYGFISSADLLSKFAPEV